MGTLYLVGTPIGNLEDLSQRAGRILGEADEVLAEDTRRTRVLMRHLGISTPLLSLYAENEVARAGEVLPKLEGGACLALVSDAGMPLVSDPGERLVRRVLEAGHDVVPVPGPSAVLTALVASGLPTLPFVFLGFTPRRGKQRTNFLERIRRSEETIVLFESPRRLARLFHDLAALGGGERRAAVGRELTKLHEEFRRGTVDSLARYYGGEERTRGEVTVVIGPLPREEVRPAEEVGEARRIARALLNVGTSASRASRELASLLGIPRNRAYRVVLDEASDPEGRRRGESPGIEREAGDAMNHMVALLSVLLLAPWHPGAGAVTLPAERGGAGEAEALPAPDAAPPTIARLQYGGGGDWYAGPSALANLLAAIRERTGIALAEREAVVTPLDPALPDYPYLYMTGHGNVAFNEQEREALRRYLLSGGFLHADDNYGLDEAFRREMAALFPDRPLVEVPPDHPVFHSFYDFPDGLPKIHEHDGEAPEAWGIFYEGRLIVFYSHESDLGNGWEDPEVHEDPPELREEALRMGVNLFVYALTRQAS